MTANLTIEQLPIPASLDDPGADDFRAFVALSNAIANEALGPAADNELPEEFLPGLLDHEYEVKQIFAARRDGEIAGFAHLSWSVDPETRITWLDVQVPLALRRQGIGTALFDHMEALCRESGRPIIQGGGFHLPVTGPRLESPTGFGSLPRNEPGVRFLLNRGYTLEQVYRYSVLRLPVDPARLQVQLEAAEAKAGSDYRVHTWQQLTPEQWLDDVATIYMRMATDAPAGNLEIDEEPWDAERVRKNDQQRIASGRTGLTAAVEHIPSGKLVAFNGLSLPEDRARPVYQGITLVLREHRGHRLGMIAKIANIRQLQDISPNSPFILTDNAEENRPMLSVNEELGFEPIAWEGAWKKVLDDRAPADAGAAP